MSRGRGAPISYNFFFFKKVNEGDLQIMDPDTAYCEVCFSNGVVSKLIEYNIDFDRTMKLCQNENDYKCSTKHLFFNTMNLAETQLEIFMANSNPVYYLELFTLMGYLCIYPLMERGGTATSHKSYLDCNSKDVTSSEFSFLDLNNDIQKKSTNDSGTVTSQTGFLDCHSKDVTSSEFSFLDLNNDIQKNSSNDVFDFDMDFFESGQTPEKTDQLNISQSNTELNHCNRTNFGENCKLSFVKSQTKERDVINLSSIDSGFELNKKTCTEAIEELANNVLMETSQTNISQRNIKPNRDCRTDSNESEKLSTVYSPLNINGDINQSSINDSGFESHGKICSKIIKEHNPRTLSDACDIAPPSNLRNMLATSKSFQNTRPFQKSERNYSSSGYSSSDISLGSDGKGPSHRSGANSGFNKNKPCTQSDYLGLIANAIKQSNKNKAKKIIPRVYEGLDLNSLSNATVKKRNKVTKNVRAKSKNLPKVLSTTTLSSKESVFAYYLS
ncbi:hypothetical protein GQR58_001799 [Nymphon striatum]|nr:hypothetical protein GQR58_001799 [Nymphon striatum]